MYLQHRSTLLRHTSIQVHVSYEYSYYTRNQKSMHSEAGWLGTNESRNKSTARAKSSTFQFSMHPQYHVCLFLVSGHIYSTSTSSGLTSRDTGLLSPSSLLTAVKTSRSLRKRAGRSVQVVQAVVVQRYCNNVLNASHIITTTYS